MFLTLLLLSYCIYAQDLTIIDYANVKCSYERKEVKDTLTGIAREDLIYLQIGDKYSKCYSFYTHRFDSLRVYGREELSRMIVTMNKNWSDIGNSYFAPTSDPFPRMTTYLFKNYSHGEMIILDRIMGDYYQYEEGKNLQEWDLQEDSTKTILGHECQKATCKFRGRVWTAWFALDIPISDGPWKFSGLPGLIMEVYDKGEQYYFCINGMQQVKSEPIYFGIVGIETKRFEKASFSAFLKAEYKFLRGNRSPLAESIGLPQTESNYIPRFDWIEREEKYWH